MLTKLLFGIVGANIVNGAKTDMARNIGNSILGAAVFLTVKEVIDTVKA